MSRNALVSMFGNDSKQPHCNKSGINTNFTYGGARLGLVGNNEGDCGSCDSAWGWGIYAASNVDKDCGAGLVPHTSAEACAHGTLWVR